jgi:SSS family solute:Na+ symporter
LVGSLGIILIAFTLLPRFLQAGIYTMPEYLEYRYNATARSIMALLTVVIYVTVLITAVLYSGALTISTVFDIDLVMAVWAIGVVAGLYTTVGGLVAVAWADLFQGLALLIGGLLVFWLGLDACGGWRSFVLANADRLHMVLPSTHKGLPWTGIVSGMWIVILYYCGLNQFIVQRALAARSIRDGQLGVILAAGLWLLVPFVIVMPGIMAVQLYGDGLSRPDAAFPTLIRSLVPSGLRGLMLAAIAGAVISSLASMINSAATVFTLDVYRRLLDRDAPQERLVLVGRIMTVICVIIGCLLAPRLQEPRFGGVFQFIQQFQGYIWPGIVGAFVFGMLVPQAPPMAGIAALICGPAIYGLFQVFATDLHFLIQVGITFELALGIMAAITFLWPLPVPRTLPSRQQGTLLLDPMVLAAGLVVACAVLGFWVVFW